MNGVSSRRRRQQRRAAGRTRWQFELAAGVVLLLLLRPSLAAAQSQQVPVGPRAVAMGGAYSSIADDATATYWNPAGLAFVGRQEFMASYANLFAADIKDNFLAYVLPLSRRQAVAADWYHSGYGDSELDFSEDRFDIAYALRFGSWLSAGQSSGAWRSNSPSRSVAA